MVSIIAAIDARGALGYRNRLLYHLPDDLRRFKRLTTGHTVLMGRKTFESLPKGALPDRRNLVISHNPQLRIPGAEVYTSIEEALAHCREDEQVFVMGGASIYRQAFPLASELRMTLIDATSPISDVFFPQISPLEWAEKSRDAHPIDERHPQSFSFVDYIRR